MPPEEFPIGSYYAIIAGTSSACALAGLLLADRSTYSMALGAAIGTVAGALAGLNSFRIDTVDVYPGMVRKRWVLEPASTVLASIAVCTGIVTAVALWLN